jgi:hypothetical protein
VPGAPARPAEERIMRAFLRENPTIAFGLGLPLLLVLVFLLISGVPSLLVAAPQYDVLYETEYYNYNNGVQISVVDRKVNVVHQGAIAGYQNPRLWRYNARTGGVQEIAINLPPGLAPPSPATLPEATAKVIPIDVPELANLTVDSSSIAPDGYRFSAGDTGYSRDILTGLFSFSRYRDEPVLTKDGRSVRLPTVGGPYYGSGARLIGWIVTP